MAQEIVSGYEELSAERKEMIAKGLLPDWYTTSGWALFKEKYLWADTPLEQYKIIARTAAAHYLPFGKEFAARLEKEFFDLIWHGIFSPSTPFLSNTGRGKAMPVSCGGQYIDDSIYGFYDARLEGAVLTQNGFGTSGYFGDIRPRGSKIRGGGEASGTMPVMLGFTQDMQLVKQNNCYLGNAEVLTEKGWIRFDEIGSSRHLRVAQVSDGGRVQFVLPTDYIEEEFQGDLIRFVDKKNIDIAVTPNHNMAHYTHQYANDLEEPLLLKRADEIELGKGIRFLSAGLSDFGDRQLTAKEKLKIAAACIGTRAIGENAIIMTVSDEERADDLLETLKDISEIGYAMDYAPGADTTFCITPDDPSYMDFSFVDLDGGTKYLEEVLQEMAFWKEGSPDLIAGDKVTFKTTSRKKSDQIQAIAALCGYRTRLDVDTEDATPVYLIKISPKSTFSTKKVIKDTLAHDGKVYCVTVPSGAILVRSYGKVIVCGNSRRGAFGGYLPITHGDFDEWANKLHHDGDKMNVGWIITDKFIEDLEAGDPEALRRYKKTLAIKMPTGKGYYFFVDKVNRHSPEAYKNNGLKVKASNLCVAPETLLLTDEGYKEIQHLEGEEVTVWNGKEWSKTKVVMTGRNQELITVRTNQGHTIDCTPYHKFYLTDGPRHGRVKEVRACELKPGDRLIKFETPVIEGSEILDKAYENGFYSGDGCWTRGRSLVYLYGDKMNLFDEFSDTYNVRHQPNQNRICFNVKGLKHKFFVPDCEYTIASRIEWLAGLLDSDGCVLTEKMHGSQSLQIASAQPGFLEEVQLVLQTMGVQAKVTHNRDSGDYLLPANDGSGELKRYSCRPVKRLLITGSGILQLLDLGLNCRRLNISGHVPNRDASGFITIKDITYTGRISDVYCLTEPKRHMCVFNGILTGQCSEITLYSDKEHSFSCILGNMNLIHWDKIKTTESVFYSTLMLHAVALEFLRLANGKPGFERVVRFTEKSMALGLGQMGLHTLFQAKGFPFDSLGAQFLNKEIAEHIQKETIRASKYLATLFGEPEWCKGTGMANTHLTSCPPTKSCVSRDAVFMTVDHGAVNYDDFLRLGGLNLDDILSITLECDDGKEYIFKYDDEVLVERNGNTIRVPACMLKEGDDVLGRG